MQLTFLIDFSILNDSFTLQIHIYSKWVATRPALHIFQQDLFYTLPPKTNLVLKVVPVEARLYM